MQTRARRAGSQSPGVSRSATTPDLSDEAAPSGEADTSNSSKVSQLEALADDLLRQVAERDVELDQLQEQHASDLEAASASTTPYSDPLWLREAPQWLRALTFAGIMALVMVLPC